MSRIMFIDGSHREQIRVAVTEKGRVTEFDIESFDKKQTIGNIYLAKVTRVEPSLQAAFVEYGSGKQGFLPFAEIHPDYYQIPLEDRKRLLEEAAAFYNNEDADDDANDDTSDNASDNASDDEHIDTHHSNENLDTTFDACEHHHTRHTHHADDDLVDRLPLTEQDTDNSVALYEADRHSHTIDLHDVSSDETLDNQEDDDKPNTKKAQTRKPRLPRYKIQEVIKKRQILLVQVIKSERGNKGASLTTYLSLAGRYCVLMPNTARGGGISRKITNIADRQKLRATLKAFDLPKGMGLIIRTAGLQRTQPELQRDYEYLMRLWDNVRQLTMSSTAPALVYEEGDLIKRTLRDVYSKDTSKVFVQGEEVFNQARDIMKMIMPSHVRYIHNYHDPVPLFSRYQIERQLDDLSSPQVKLKSGGYLVINHTEALIAIDVNSGKSTSSYSIEETALRTNLEAAEEIARQFRLRDLAGLIVIDFIDMEDYGNVRQIERKMRDFLRNDKARLQTAPISMFGLMEITRQRLRPAMKDLMSVPCDHCQGMGFVLSLETSALRVLRAVFEEIAQKPIAEVSVNCTIDIAHYLLNKKRKELLAVEQEYDLVININGLSKYARLEYDIETVLKDPTKIVKIPKAYQEEDYEEQIIDSDIEANIALDESSETDDNSYASPRGRRTRDKRRGNNRRGEKADQNRSVAPVDDTIVDEETTEAPHRSLYRGRSGRHNDKRQAFNNKRRGRFDVPLSETPDIVTTASGNEVIIENRVSVNYPVAGLQIVLSEVSNETEVKPVYQSETTNTFNNRGQFEETIPTEILDNSVTDTYGSATHTMPENGSDDGEVITQIKPIAQTTATIPQETQVYASQETVETQAAPTQTPTETTPEQKSARRGWWRNRFGL